jgi:hypothetical protein
MASRAECSCGPTGCVGPSPGYVHSGPFDDDEEVRAMAELDAKKREKIPTKEFGLPEKARTKDAKKESGNYPMPDKAHARNAKARAAQQQQAGRLTKQERERIERKADKILDD